MSETTPEGASYKWTQIKPEDEPVRPGLKEDLKEAERLNQERLAQAVAEGAAKGNQPPKEGRRKRVEIPVINPDKLN